MWRVTSKHTDRVLATANWVEVNPAESRYVTIWPEKDKTVRYNNAQAKEGRKAEWAFAPLLSHLRPGIYLLQNVVAVATPGDISIHTICQRVARYDVEATYLCNDLVLGG
jgi:hypothetical protein